MRKVIKAVNGLAPVFVLLVMIGLGLWLEFGGGKDTGEEVQPAESGRSLAVPAEAERRIATPVCGPARNDEPESETAKTPHPSPSATPSPQGEDCEGCDQVEGQWWTDEDGFLASLEMTEPEVWWTEEDVRMLAALLEHESIDLPGDEAVRPLWCVLNRMESPAFPDSVYGVLTQRGQFMASYGTPRESTVQRVREELLRYEAWRSGESDDRPLPEGLYFYFGCGRYNEFRTEYRGGRRWAQGVWIL